MTPRRPLARWLTAIDAADRLEAARAPDALRDGRDRYVAEHLPTGSFLLAVLEDDRSAAARRPTQDARR